MIRVLGGYSKHVLALCMPYRAIQAMLMTQHTMATWAFQGSNWKNWQSVSERFSWAAHRLSWWAKARR